MVSGKASSVTPIARGGVAGIPEHTRSNLLDYEQLHLDVSGPETGAPVLLLHGSGSSALLMHPIADALADRYRVYNLDLPGHGLSPQPPEPWGVPNCSPLVSARRC